MIGGEPFRKAGWGFEEFGIHEANVHGVESEAESALETGFIKHDQHPASSWELLFSKTLITAVPDAQVSRLECGLE